MMWRPGLHGWGFAFFHRLAGGWRQSLRVKLVTLALLPLLAAVPLVILALFGGGSWYFEKLLVTKIRSDLAVAHGHFEKVTERVGLQVESLAQSESLAIRLRHYPETLGTFLQARARQLKLDYLLLLDAQGQLLAASAAQHSHPNLEQDPVTQNALLGTHGTAIEVLDEEALAAIDRSLPGRAETPLLPTLNAAPSRLSSETRGMVVHSAAPIQGSASLAGGVLVGGLLLNKNLAFVDQVNAIVYPTGALPLGSVGTVTLFLDDVRIATNVRLFAGGRAIGTRVSAAVRQSVLSEGQTWLDRAFVVNDWYVSAYEPIHNAAGQRIGMLYVGFLEAPFRQARNLAVAVVISYLLLAALGAAWVSLRFARHVLQPVERMHVTMNALEGGAAATRVGRVASEDELAALAAHFDRLLDQLDEHTAALRRWGDELDDKVAERTRELANANASLRSAQLRLVRTEKLAAIGQLAAGVAHEINNPVAVIQGNLDVLCESLGAATKPVEAEIRLLQEQVYRIRLIVAKLLQFSRPSEFAGFIEPVNVTQVVQDSLVLVGHQMKKSGLRMEQALYARRDVMINRNELQQVLINLIVNALQALHGHPGGMVTLVSGECERDGIEGVYIAVVDNGPGISEANRERLFAPFFTTKNNEGSGLGLWVSLSLVQRYGGDISVESPPEGGAVFTVWLPCETSN